jgi:gamma-glutamyltranspeptidase/glutathione hydrolase
LISYRTNSFKKLSIFFLILFLSCNINTRAQDWYSNGVVSSADEIASQVGIDILKNGGNAVDAAVGVGFALAVVYPQAGNIGGGGFMVIHLAPTNAASMNTSIDYREKAPSNAFRDMYLDANGNIVNGLSTKGHLAGGVPGSVAGMLMALDKYGKMGRKNVMKYAIELAENGFHIGKRFADLLNEYQNEFRTFPSTMKIFGGKFKSSDLIVQKDLANTLKLISEQGSDGFYKGYVADCIVNEMKKENGIITHQDLENYHAVERDVLTGTYHGYEIISMAPPSSGGISFIYLLNILENYDLKSMGYSSAESIALMTEAMRRVYADRSQHMGDMDFYAVPVRILISKEYAKERFKDFDNSIASKSENISHGEIKIIEKENTTHYSVADQWGNCVSVTTTINDNFGSKLVIDGAGFFFNNEMDDFVSKPGVPNMYGLLGSDANAIQPNKRMLSSMTPTIILKDNKPFMITGSPGGGRIITTVLTNIVNVIDFGMSLQDAINKPRFHHQWYPDEIQVESGLLSSEERKKLEARGYKINDFRNYGSIDAIIFNAQGQMSGHSDRRGYGKAIGY